MRIHRTFVIVMMLVAAGVLMPRHGYAQQTDNVSSDAATEDAAAVAGRGDRRDRFDRERRQDDEQEDDGTQGGGNVNVQIVAVADERTNSVVVRGPAELLDLVAEVLSSLDDTTVEVAGVKIFQLRYADAMNVADIINNLFGEEQSSQADQRGGFMMFRPPFGGSDRRQSQDDESGSKLTVTAAADSQTNTVVVTGPNQLLEVVAGVVEKLDTQIPNLADVKVFHLEYADAQDTSELINEVFGESASSSRSTRSSGQQNQMVRFMRGGSSQQGAQGGGISDVQVIASADSQTNSVVVSGPAETLEAIADVIKELDVNPEQERRIFVYALKNATATNLMEILNNLFMEMQALDEAGSSRTGQQFQGRQAAPTAQAAGGTSDSGDDLSEETYFEADADTNSLLIMTSTKNYEKIKPILDELDKPIGQVLIKVLFAEITHNNDIDFGMEFSMVNLYDDGDRTTTETLFGEPDPRQGLFINSIAGDLDVTLHALQ
ncbi:MAG: hypothetical protein JW741_02965, partial [Sedimentisphaerales bacterium]|nr:hypothetical protein [Sedimentisphaerales bacterium]